MEDNKIAYSIISLALFLPVFAFIFLLDYFFSMPNYLKYLAVGWVSIFFIFAIMNFFNSKNSSQPLSLSAFAGIIMSAIFPLLLGLYYLIINYLGATISTIFGIAFLIFSFYKVYSFGKKEVEKEVNLYFTNVLDNSWKRDNVRFNEHIDPMKKEFIFRNQFKEVADLIFSKNELLKRKSFLQNENENIRHEKLRLEKLNESNEKKIKALSNVVDSELPQYLNQKKKYTEEIRRLEEHYLEINKELEITHMKKNKNMKRKLKGDIQQEIEAAAKEIARLEKEHKDEKERLIKESNNNLDEAINDLNLIMKEKVKEYKKNFLLSFHDNNEEEFSASKIFERQREEEKMKKRHDELDKKEIDINILKNNLENKELIFEFKKEFYEKNKDLESKISEETLQRRQDVIGLKADVTDLKSYVLEGLNTLNLFVKEGFLKIREATKTFRLEVTSELNSIKFKLGTEVAELSNNQMKLVNKFENFQIKYDGDKRELKQQFDGVYLYIDRVAFEAHKYTETVKQTFSGEILALRNTNFELQKNLFLVEANLKQNLSNLETKVDKNALKAEFERERISRDSQRKIEKVIDRLNLTNSEFRFLIKESNYVMKDFVNRNYSQIKNDLQAHRSETAIQFEKISNRLNISVADIKYLVNQKNYELKDFTKQNIAKVEKDLQTHRHKTNYLFNELSQKFNISTLEIKYLMKEKNYEIRDFVKGNISRMEKDLESFRVQNREQIYNLDKEYRSTIKDFAYKFDIQIKDIYHLMNTENLNIKQLMEKSHHELKSMIDKMKTNNDLLHTKSEARWSTIFKDAEIQNERKHYQTLQVIQGFKNHITGFERSINTIQNELGKMDLNIKRYGVENEKVKQDANKLYNDADKVLNQIIESIDDFDRKVGMENDKMAIKAKQNMLDAKDIVMQQRNAVKQIALGQKGVELMFNEREESIRRIQNEVNYKEREIKRIEEQGKKDLLSDLKIAELKRQRNASEEALKRESEMASYWKKESRQKPTYSQYHHKSFDFPEEDSQW